MSAVLNSGAPTPVRAVTEPRPSTAVVDASPAALMVMSAEERIDASRLRLRHAMLANAKPAAATEGGSGARPLIETIRSMPGVSLVADTVVEWWAKHPLHDASIIASEASGAIFRPIARDNPVKLVFGGLLFGAFLMVLKPWRFILRSAIFAGLVPQLAAMVLRRLPLTTWIGMFVRRSKGSGTKVSSRRGLAPSTGTTTARVPRRRT